VTEAACGAYTRGVVHVAVIGGSGFVGRHVVARLLESHHAVTTADLRAPPSPLPNERVLEADVLASDAFQKIAERLAAVDHVVWLAANIRHGGVNEHADEDVRLSVEAPLTLLRLLSPAPRAFVYLSSVQVYGRPVRLPVDEDHPTEPFTSYGVAKLLGEQALAIAGQRLGTPVASLRIAFVYGPGQHQKNVLPRFIAAVREGKAPTIHGAGNDVRDDVYVGDVANAVGLALERRAQGVFNIASGRPHSLLEVARTVCKLGPAGLVPQHVDVETSWIDRYYAVDRARAELGFLATTPFEQGVREMWEKSA